MVSAQSGNKSDAALSVLQYDTVNDIRDVFTAIDRLLNDFVELLPLDHFKWIETALEQLGEKPNSKRNSVWQRSFRRNSTAWSVSPISP